MAGTRRPGGGRRDAAAARAAGPVRLKYWPRAQFRAFHQRPQRWALILAHRRAGKTVAAIGDAILRAIRLTQAGRQSPRLAYIGPTYRQTKDIAWEYLKRFTADFPGVETNETELRVDLPGGARIRLYGAENYQTLRGLYFDHVTIDEAADLDERAWPEVIRPALADRKGSATFIGTPRGRNWFYRLAHGDTESGWEGALRRADWFTLVLRASETGILDAEELASSRQTMTQEEYDQEYECSFDAATQGAYFATEFRRIDSDGRIRSVPVDRYAEVHTAWDIGRTDSTVIWFLQRSGRWVHVVDYYEASGVGLDHYAKVVRDWRERYEIAYGTHYLPHDIRVTELTTDKSRLLTLQDLGVRPVMVVPNHNRREGINATRRLLDRCYFDTERCRVGIDHLRQYAEAFDKTRRVRLGVPDKKGGHDHAADALRQYAAISQDIETKTESVYRRKTDANDKRTWMSI